MPCGSVATSACRAWRVCSPLPVLEAPRRRAVVVVDLRSAHELRGQPATWAAADLGRGTAPMSRALALPSGGGSTAGSGAPAAARGRGAGSVGLVADLSQKLARQRKQCVAPTSPRPSPDLAIPWASSCSHARLGLWWPPAVCAQSVVSPTSVGACPGWTSLCLRMPRRNRPGSGTTCSD